MGLVGYSCRVLPSPTFQEYLMNEIISLQSQTIDGNTVETVSARELHAFVESKQEFANWIKNRIEKYGFIEGYDFLIILSKTPNGGRPS